MRSPGMVKAFEQFRLMTTKYMDPGIAGRDYDTATAMIAKGKAVFMIMGDWQIGIFGANKMSTPADYMCAQAPTNWGKPGFILNSDSVVLFKRTDPDYIAGQKLQAHLILSPQFQTVFNQAKGSIPARLDVDLSKGFTPCQQTSQKDLQASIAAGTLARSFAHNMTILQKYRGAAMDVITSYVNNPKMSAKDGANAMADAVERRSKSPTLRSRLAGRSSKRKPMSAVSDKLPPFSPARPGWRARLSSWTPALALAPSLAASFLYVFVLNFWTFYISVSNSTLLASYGFVGLKPYFELWSNQRWRIAYSNLFFFSGFYVVLALLIGLALAIAIDQRVKGEAIWRTIFLYPLAVSFIVTGAVWRRLYSPDAGIEFLVRSWGWSDFTFRLTSDRDLAIYTIIATGVWQSSGFAMALFLAGLRSVDPDIVKAAQIDSASRFRIYRKVILPAIMPIFIAVAVVLLQFAIKTFDLVVALTNGGPGIATTFPANYVYELMFRRGQIAIGAGASIMMLAALSVVIGPYALWVTWRSNREGRTHG